MEALLLRLQKDVAARKRAPSDVYPTVRNIGFALLTFFLAYQLGIKSSTTGGLFTAVADATNVIDLSAQIEAQKGEFDILQARIERLEKAYQLSSRYGIGANLAMQIEEVARSEGIEPQLAFDLVRVESEFNHRAVSPVGALGLTQLMPETARLLSPGITRQQIFDPETNLRLGFRFFRSLLNYYHGDVKTALLAYNRGPTIVDRLIANGIDPNNGYAHAVLGPRYSSTE
jgi:soluble lytic murein transglycosylase-like protein